ncbi:MAG: amino acid ABC transporter substrate-binding protein [Spirochaetaceae bacterium]|nr:amino acid ABC transporter substrate-binding protein [Spirochaetaceae bacterium]
MKRYVHLLLLLVLSFTACQKQEVGLDDISLSRLYLNGSIKIGLDVPYQPLAYVKDGYFVGFDIDVIDEICAVLDLTPEYIAIDWGKKDELLENGDIDIIASGFSKTPEREPYYGMSEPYIPNVLCIVVRSNETRFTDFQSLNGMRVGFMRGSTAQDYLEMHQDESFSIESRPYATLNEALQNLSSMAVDAVLGDMIVVSYLTNVENRTNLKILPVALSREYFVYGFRKNDKALLNAFNESLRQLARDDILAKITRKWFKNDISLLR